MLTGVQVVGVDGAWLARQTDLKPSRPMDLGRLAPPSQAPCAACGVAVVGPEASKKARPKANIFVTARSGCSEVKEPKWKTNVKNRTVELGFWGLIHGLGVQPWTFVLGVHPFELFTTDAFKRSGPAKRFDQATFKLWKPSTISIAFSRLWLDHWGKTWEDTDQPVGIIGDMTRSHDGLNKLISFGRWLGVALCRFRFLLLAFLAVLSDLDG